MAIEQANAIIQALTSAQEARVARMRLAQEQIRDQNERDYRQKVLDETIRQHDTENKRTDLATKAAISIQKLQQLEMQQKISEGSNASGIPVPGAQVQTPTKGGDLIPGAIGVQTPAQPGTQTLAGMGANGEDLILPFDPQAYRQHQQDILEATKGPASPEARARMAEYQAQYSMIGQNQKDLAQFQNALPMTEYQKANLASEEKRAKDAKAAQMYDTNVQAGAHIRAAQISAGLETGDGTDAAAAPYIQQVHNGQLSSDQLNALKLPKGVHNAVVAGVAQDGGVLPTKDELGAVSKYAPVAQLIPAIDEYNKLLVSDPYNSRIVGTDAYKKRQALEAQIETQTPGIARSIGTETGRLSNQQIQMSQDLVKPGTNFLTSNPDTNQQKRDTLLKLANSAVDANLSRLPAAQAASIKAKTGLTGLQYGAPQPQQPTIQQPQQRPGQPQGATHQWTPNGVVPIQQPQGNPQ